MKKTIIFPLLLLSLFFLACQAPQGEEYFPQSAPSTPEISPEPVPETSSPAENETGTQSGPFNISCTHNENCTPPEFCIEAQCQLLETFYPTNKTCLKCKISRAEILTSDHETYTLSPGQGSYTAASALEWKLLSPPPYCQGEKPLVPIKLLKRNYGQVFSDELILLKEAQTSKTITHPLAPEVAFTLTIKNIEEVCS